MQNLPDHQTNQKVWLGERGPTLYTVHTNKHLLSQDVQENLITTVRLFDCGNFLTVLATEQ